ncbi:MAG: DNA-processing protein DprA [Planctomycetota bacterium]
MKTVANRDGALRAALVPGFTPRRWRRFVDRAGDPALLAAGDLRPLARWLGIGRSEAAALARELRRADPARELDAAAAAAVAVHPWGEEGYPRALYDLADPPPVVYQRGELLGCDAQAVAVVGSRRATPYGLRIARTLAGDLARAGVTIVAGLARGIDAAAHQAALEAGGRTLAVLGSGLLEPYPPEHVGLLEQVAGAGAALSEFPLHAPPLPRHFPQRNRLIAALTVAVVVVEATERSGALSTVRHALDLGRTVLAVPGPVDQETSRGTLRLLYEGATPVGSAQDVFAALGWCPVAAATLPRSEREALEALGEQGGAPKDVARATGMTEEVAAGLLVTLEVRGLVARREGGRYDVK